MTGRWNLTEARTGTGSDLQSLIPRLFDQLADSVYIMDPDGVIQYVNPAFEELTGYCSAEVVGQDACFLESGVHPDAVQADMWATIRAGTPFRFVFTNRKKNGDVYEEGVMVSPIKDQEGITTHYLHMGRQIRVTRQTYDVFTLLANSAPAGIYLHRDGAFFFVNEYLSTLLGCPASELVGKAWLEFVVEEDRDRVTSEFESVAQGSTAGPVEARIVSRDGSMRWIMASLQQVTLHGPAAVAGDFFAGYVVDITGRKEAEERLSSALAMYAATTESTTDGIVVIDNSRQLVSHNQRFAQIWKLDSILEFNADSVREAVTMLLRQPEDFRDIIEQTWADPMMESMGSFELNDGRTLEYFTKPQVIDGAVAGRVWSWRDVTERQRFEAALIRLANHDSLTGLMSRRKIQEEIDLHLAKAQDAHGALLLLDLDGFKEVNDGFGHQAGDEVLGQVARVMTDSNISEHLGRFGGDEFAILLPGVGSSEAQQAATHILQRLSGHAYIAAGHRISITGSMGIALYPAHATTSDELLSAADLALYEAKSQGQNRLQVFTPKLRKQSRLRQRGDWQTKVREAISERRGHLYAEKTVPLRGNGPAIFRLAMRLSGSHRWVLSAGELDLLTQQASLSLDLDRWLLQEATALAQQPSFIATSTGLAFEISPQSLSHSDVLKRLLDLAALRAAHDCPLVIEPTNFDSLSEAQAEFTALRTAGYRFKVPDAGTEALARTLKTLPVDYLRLDSSVVSEMAQTPQLRPLIAGAIDTARRLGARTVAENVPDEATLSLLRELGLDYARGTPIDRARNANSVFKNGARKLRAA
jgi:diguanylate cyclase (GGDEF)-like protein/PAS domain S-box-containing protein